MTTFASLFSGGGGADIGAIAAGFTPLWAVEHDAAIADVYRANLGDHIITADVCNVDYATLPRVDWLHASPVCTRYSVANAQRGESDLDIATAQATARAIEAVGPRYVTIENVAQYAGSDALRLITASLDRLGYWWHAEVMNSADYGVPQTRRRLIVRASIDMLRPMPQAQRWIGWYEAIEDLIPTLPPSKFADWQLKRLPEEVTGSVLVRAGNACQEWGKGYRDQCEPHMTVTQDGLTRAFISDAAQPAHTTRAQQAGRYRAFLVEGRNGNGGTDRWAHEPAGTITRSHPPRAWLSTGRVVAMNSRALSVFQSFPRSYILPDKTALACRIVGNAKPPRLAQVIGENW